MNILFHTTTAISVAVLLTDTNRIKQSTNSKIIYWTSFFAFTVSLISHGALDYIPHGYPINSKFDAIAGLLEKQRLKNEHLQNSLTSILCRALSHSYLHKF